LIIEKVKLYRLKVPLKRPYKIATAALKDFDFTLVALQASGHEGLGEAMADLKGYFWETAEEVWQFARDQGGKLLGQTLRQERATMRYNPFLDCHRDAVGVLSPNALC